MRPSLLPLTPKAIAELWLLYSTPYDIPMKENNKLRHMCLVGMNLDDTSTVT